jgi:putative ABC transport system permease protein
LYDAIEPLMIVLNTTPNLVFVRLQAGEPSQLLASLENTWKEVNPNHPFEYQFLDQDFDSQYRADEKRSQIFTAFSGLTIMIACLGLLGLSAFTTEQRTKEIGVRKILGSSVQSLVMLVSKEFFVLVGIGMVLSFPVAWYFTDQWLQNFAYRIELKNEWPTFLVASVLAFVITMITVGYYVIRASIANPVKALREE